MHIADNLEEAGDHPRGNHSLADLITGAMAKRGTTFLADAPCTQSDQRLSPRPQAISVEDRSRPTGRKRFCWYDCIGQAS